MALHHREESGEGQIVDASLLGGNMYSQSLDMQAYLAMRDDRFLEPVSRLDSGNPMSGPMYPSADGRWVTLAMPDTDKYWPAFSGDRGPRRRRPALRHPREALRGASARDAAGARGALHQAAGLALEAGAGENQLPADVIQKYDYPATDHNAAVNRYVLNLDHPSHGAIQSLGFPIYMSESPARLRSMAPCTGQHSARSCREMLGYPNAQVEDFETASGIIHT